MLKVALTGGIATGKSYVLNSLRRRGVHCLDADELTHGVMTNGTETTQAIVRRFGPDVIAADGSVDRRKLGRIVFSDKSARADLEAIVHPAVYRSIAAGLRAFELARDVPFAVVDVPLLYETGHQGDFDRVIVTACSIDQQLQRIIGRGMSEAEARQRLAAQWPSEKKSALADYVIDTGGTTAETDRQVDGLLRNLTSG
jgi:dephospho-CoA kinase